MKITSINNRGEIKPSQIRKKQSTDTVILPKLQMRQQVKPKTFPSIYGKDLMLNLESIKKFKAASEVCNKPEQQDAFQKVVEQLKRKNKKGITDMERIRSIVLPPLEMSTLRSFENSDKKFILDRYQQEAINSFISGANTIVTAPTGTGKTLIAEYGIDDMLKKGQRIIYLSPLKALSNEKFTKFAELFGKYDEDGNFLNSDNVGIITGDIIINPDAQVLVMTTEIYRNMVNSNDEDTIAKTFKDFGAVIYDEFHYLHDPDRGTVWEESVMQTPKHMKQMMLSATASNAREIASWLQSISSERKTNLVDVPEEERYIPLKEYVYGFDIEKGCCIKPLFTRKISLDYVKKLNSDRMVETLEELEEIFNGEDCIDILSQMADKNGLIDCEEFSSMLTDKKGVSEEKAQQIALILADPKETKRNDIKLTFNPKKIPITNVAKVLYEQNKTPALFFVFSKRKCRKHIEETSKRLGSLLTPEEAKRVLDVVNEAKEKGIYLGRNFEDEYLPKLLMGYAVHHAGMLPAYKSLIEKLSREGLIKICYATETLLAGINMPFKTTVFTASEKISNNNKEQITPTLYKQGSGRAGRRGKDDLGNVIICPISDKELSVYRSIIESKDTGITSSFNLSYATLIQTNPLNNLDKFLERSFYAYQKGSAKEIKKQANRKINYLIEKGYLTEQNGKLSRTQKGDMAKNVYGINQVLFCELISDQKYTKDLSPEELAAMMTIFADVKDDKPKTDFSDDMQSVAEKLTPAINLAKEIINEQKDRKIDEEIKMSTNLAQAVLKFALTPNCDEESCLNSWKEIFTQLRTQYMILHEGDLLRVFNSTIDLLKTIIEASDDPELRTKADMAIKCLKKPPLTDILKYELNIK